MWTVSKFTQKSYDSILDTFDHFTLTMGLKINYDKTLVLQIGLMEKSDPKLYSHKPIIWTDEPLKIPGVWIYTDIQKVMKMNFDVLFEKLYLVTKDWQHRSLMVLGRILIANTLLTSLFQYKLLCLLSPFTICNC